MNKKYILSLDGGGVRTLATITFLRKLENELGIKIHEKFDYFVGTSAGAISCLGLSVKRFSANELQGMVQSEPKKNHEKIFMGIKIWSFAIKA